MDSTLNKLLEYTYSYISKKDYFIHFCCLFLKLFEAFSVCLRKSNQSTKLSEARNCNNEKKKLLFNEFKNKP